MLMTRACSRLAPGLVAYHFAARSRFPALPPAPPSFAATQNLMQTAVLISSMSKPLTLIIIILLTIGFIVAVVGVSGGFLLNS